MASYLIVQVAADKVNEHWMSVVDCDRDEAVYMARDCAGLCVTGSRVRVRSLSENPVFRGKLVAEFVATPDGARRAD